MTPEQRIAQLEDELARERAVVDDLRSILRTMSDREAREMARQSMRSARNARYEDRLGAECVPEIAVRLRTPEEQEQYRRQQLELANRVPRPEARIRAKEHVYFIQVGEHGPIKIGVSKSPGKRLAQLQTSHAEPLQLRAVQVGGRDLEMALHERFAAYRMSGEWFTPATDIVNYYLSIKAGG